MRGGWSNRRKATILGLVCVAASVLTWFYARIPWFLVSVFLTAWAWLIALAQMWHFRHENRRPGRSAPSYNRPRSSTPQPRPPVPRPPVPRPPAPRPTGPGEPARRVPRKRGKHQDGPLGPEARVTLAAEREASGVEEIFVALDRDLVGLRPVKQKVEEIAALLMVDRVRQRFGLDAPRPNQHMCFTGPPGTGKTTVALRMADLLYRLGYLERGHLVHAMRNDLVGEYIGQTAPKTKQVLERAKGGVLFIDEAYYLYRADDSKDYGQESIEILLQVMENDRDQLVVILAGYQDRMDDFFSSNPGMSSRIAHHLDFAPYAVDELMAIGQVMIEQSQYYLSEEAKAAFREYLTHRMELPRFAYARSVRNELERSRLRHAHRLASDLGRRCTRDDLMRIEPPDIGSSQVFAAATTADNDQ
ncbi:MAG TPA: AAA family ATPase [Streptosporangiaceae bacterium]